MSIKSPVYCDILTKMQTAHGEKYEKKANRKKEEHI